MRLLLVLLARWDSLREMGTSGLILMAKRQHAALNNIASQRGSSVLLLRWKMKPRLPATDWNQLRAAYTAGAGLRSLARKAGIAEGTLLSKAHREGWTQLKREALELMRGPKGDVQRDITQSIASESAERGQRHVERMAGLCDALGEHAASLTPAALFDQISKLNVFDLVARRSLGLESVGAGQTVNILVGGEGGFDGPSIAIDSGEWED